MRTSEMLLGAFALMLAALAKHEWGGRCEERPVALTVGIYPGDAFVKPRKRPFARRRRGSDRRFREVAL